MYNQRYAKGCLLFWIVLGEAFMTNLNVGFFLPNDIFVITKMLRRRKFFFQIHYIWISPKQIQFGKTFGNTGRSSLTCYVYCFCYSFA